MLKTGHMVGLMLA